MQAEFAIIGGTGVYEPGLLEGAQEVVIDTRYGTARAVVGQYKGKRIAFLPRHGAGHSVPPHRINYRANIMALQQLGVTQVFATGAVGTLRTRHRPGSLVMVDSFLDFTKSRPSTFFDEEGEVVHVDMSDPYCRRLRQVLAATARDLGYDLYPSGTYVCTEGPRFETPAEIRYYQSIGGSVVGMTSVPEVVLAKEAQMCYATVCMVTNWAAGMTAQPLTHQEVIYQMQQNVARLRNLFFNAIERLTGERNCACGHSVSGQVKLTGSRREDARA